MEEDTELFEGSGLERFAIKKGEKKENPTETFYDQTTAHFSDLCSLRSSSVCKYMFKLHF